MMLHLLVALASCTTAIRATHSGQPSRLAWKMMAWCGV